MAPSSNGRSISSGYTSGRNLYTSGQCTYYVFDRVGGKVGSTWGNASNWANAAARVVTVNNTPKWCNYANNSRCIRSRCIR